MLDFRIDTFLTACRLLNFTQTARELGITQPAVSQHIHYLEDYYQTALFGIEGKKLSLTEQGTFLYHALTTMKDDAFLLQKNLSRINDRQKPLYLGATMTVGEFLLPRKLSRFIQKNPERDIKVTLANTNGLLEQLRSGNIDFAIVEGYFPKEEYDSLNWCKEKFLAVASVKHTFAKTVTDMNDLLEETLILRESGSGTREILERHLQSLGYQTYDFKNSVEISNMNAIRILTQEDCGITFLYESVVKDALTAGKLQCIELPHFPLTHNISFIWRKNSLYSDSYRKIYEELH